MPYLLSLACKYAKNMILNMIPWEITMSWTDQKNITTACMWLPKHTMLSAPCLDSNLQLSISEKLIVAHLLERVTGKVHLQVNIEETLYMQLPCDGSAAG